MFFSRMTRGPAVDLLTAGLDYDADPAVHAADSPTFNACMLPT